MKNMVLNLHGLKDFGNCRFPGICVMYSQDNGKYNNNEGNIEVEQKICNIAQRKRCQCRFVIGRYVKAFSGITI